MGRTKNPATAFSKHDHQSCCGDVLENADRRVKQAGLRMTPVRRRVLEILLEGHHAMGAYQVLERLAEEGFGKQPPVAYRALEFLVENGLAHRISRLNAFTACMQPSVSHSPTFFICTKCNGVAEARAQTVGNALNAVSNKMGFQIDRMSIEVMGTCETCLLANPT
ncbi:MAG: Fur family transcriptional regulator [Paracoccaceae bacterium]